MTDSLSYHVGLDLGRSQVYSSVAIVEARYAKEERNRLKAHWYSNSEVNGSP